MIIALNNKCNLTREEFLKYQEKLENMKELPPMILCPTNLYLGEFHLSNMKLGAQNVSSKGCGAYTGEVSASQLKSIGVAYCIVGHSERREYQKETDQEINEKIKQLLKEGIFPILCVGETKAERERNLTTKKITEELEEATKDLTDQEKQQIIIAYEPIWAIGTGIIPTNDEIKEIMTTIKEAFPNNKVLYGGSANESNIDQLKEITEIDGYLLGGLSLKPETLKIFFEKLKN